MRQLLLGTANLADQVVWRIGYKPNPWAYSAWSYSNDGVFPGRWDSPHACDFRTLYVGESLLGCFLEVLADHRRDAILDADLDAIEVDENEPETIQSGELPVEWVQTRAIGRAHLSGAFCQVSSKQSLSGLYPKFIRTAIDLGQPDFDAAAVRSGHRGLTQPIASYLHRETDLNGVQFESRWGDDEVLWAIFERAGDKVTSPTLTEQNSFQLSEIGEDLAAAMDMLGLVWGNLPDPEVMPFVAASEDEILRQAFPPSGNPTPFTPLGSAWLWHKAFFKPGYERARDVMTFDPTVWDFDDAKKRIEGRSFRTHVQMPYPGDQDIAYVGLVKSPAQNVQVIETAPYLTLWIVMVRIGKIWKVWGIPADDNTIVPRSDIRLGP